MNKKIIYFDNAATSHYKPKKVLKTLFKSLKNSANAGRSGHKLSIYNSVKIWETRETLAKYFGGIEPENIIFTKNCTEALNIVIQGTLQKGKNVVCSCFEHNSILRPLNELANKELITLTIVTPKNNKFITVSDIEEKISSNTYLVCVNSISNVTGNQNDIFNIAKLCSKKNILFLVDNAQGCGHVDINIKTHNISFLTFAGHKGFLAPQSIGGLCINSKVIPKPIIFGGTGSESINMLQPTALPERLESGTLSTPDILALNTGVLFIRKNFYKHSKKVYLLTEYLFNKLKSKKGIKIYSKPNFISGIISFNYKNYDSVEISEYLDKKYNIATRSGLHCAPLTHKFYNTTQKGMVRISLCFKNTKKQINLLIKAINNFER